MISVLKVPIPIDMNQQPLELLDFRKSISFGKKRVPYLRLKSPKLRKKINVVNLKYHRAKTEKVIINLVVQSRSTVKLKE